MFGRPLYYASDQPIVDAVQRIGARTRRRDGHRRHGLAAQAPGRQRPDRRRHETAAPHRRGRRARPRITEDDIRSLEQPYTPREPTYC
jgi:hypothetical protein